MDRTRTPPAWRDAPASESAPILEHDPAREAVLEPDDAVPRKDVVPAEISERCVLCFFHDAIAALVTDGTLTRVTELRTEMSPQPVYELEEAGQRLTLVHPGLGAPMAAAFMEENDRARLPALRRLRRRGGAAERHRGGASRGTDGGGPR